MTEELNLRELFANFVKFINRNITLLLSFVGISCVLVLLYYTLIRPPHYSSTAICTSQITEFEEKKEFQRPAVDLINHLQFFIQSKDFNALADLLGIETEIASQLIKIEAVQLYQMDLNEQYITLDRFTINIVVTSSKFYREIEDGFLYYFNDNKFLTDLSSLYSEGRRRIYNDVVEEINALQAQRGFKKTGDFINTEITASTSVNEIFYLSSVRERINRELKYKSLSYVQPFSKISIPNNDILVWTGLAAVVSFIFGLFVALIREIKIK
ncbi:MAG: hypothetical protein ACKVJ6_05480 [Flavobacteriales bacterium]|jgi:hypothetical protein|tara:strand:+ start:198 stop:1007 length:810 start_codon:yes stop_codon:yes gene_type:complete